jgi:hypothetical protein
MNIKNLKIEKIILFIYRLMVSKFHKVSLSFKLTILIEYQTFKFELLSIYK